MKSRNSDLMKKCICQNRLLSFGVAITIIGAVLVGIIPPLILERMINELTGSRQIPISMMILYLVMLGIAGIFDAGKEGLITIFGQKVTHTVRSEMSEKLTRLPASYYTEHEAGIIASRFVNDVDTIETLFDSGIISMIADGCKVISILVIIFVKSKGLGVLMLIVTPLLMVLTLTIQKRMLKAQVENREAVGKANNHIPETLQNIRMIHTFGIEAYMEKKYDTFIEDGYHAIEKSNFYDAIYSPIIITISAGLISVMMVCSAMGNGMQTFFGMSVGTAVAVISYVSKVFDPLENIGMEIQNIQSAVAGLYRINEFLAEKERTSGINHIKHPNQKMRDEDTIRDVDTEQDIDTEQVVMGQASYHSVDPAIAFENVHFGYTREQEILHNVNFAIADKASATIMGRTGIGKSTAFKLILGFYEPWSGSVKIYGKPVEEYSDSERANLIGYVEQSFHMVSGTVRDQITLHDEQIPDENVLHAMKLVGLDSRVDSLPDGLDTICSESLFSQGQMQQLSIARAIVRNPKILLLDEMTANLDSMTEKAVLAALDKASADRTVLSISHRGNVKKEKLEMQNDSFLCLIV